MTSRSIADNKRALLFMARYLNPKSDLVFKKIFGEHPKLLKSFLNDGILLAQWGENLIDATTIDQVFVRGH